MPEAFGGLIPKNEVAPQVSNDEDATNNLGPIPDKVPDKGAQTAQESEKQIEYDKPLETRAQAVVEVFNQHADELSDKLFDLKVGKASFEEQVEAFRNLQEVIDAMNEVDVQSVFGEQVNEERFKGLVNNEYHRFTELKSGLEKQVARLAYQYEGMGVDPENVSKDESEQITKKIEQAAEQREATEAEKSKEIQEQVKNLAEKAQEFHAKWILDNAEMQSAEDEPTQRLSREKMQDTERALEGIVLERGVLQALEGGLDSSIEVMRERTQSLGGVEEYTNIQLELRNVSLESPAEEINRSLGVVERNVDEMQHQVDLLQERLRKIDEMATTEMPGVDNAKKNELLQSIRADISRKMTTVDTRLWMANSMLDDLRQDKIAKEAFEKMEQSGEYELEELGILVDTQAIGADLARVEQQARERVGKLREQLPGSKFEDQEEFQIVEGIKSQELGMEQEEKEIMNRLQEIKNAIADQEAIIDKYRNQYGNVVLHKKKGVFGWFADMANSYQLQKILTAEGSGQTAKDLLAAREQLDAESDQLVTSLAETKVKRNIFRLRRVQVEKQIDDRRRSPRQAPRASA